MKSEDMIQQLVAAFSVAPVESYPFDHVLIQDALPNYEEIIRSLPSNGHSTIGRSGPHSEESGARKIYTLRLGDSNEVLATLAGALRSAEFESAVRGRFKEALEARFGPKHAKVKLVPNLYLVSDTKGYAIGIHTDIPKKGITVQFYIPEDESMIEMGATYYHEVGGVFEAVKKLPYKPNYCHAFVVNDYSWHSASGFKIEKPRNSIMLIYYVDSVP